MGPTPAAVQPETVDVKFEDLQKYAGLWRDEKTHFPVRTTLANGALRVGDNALRPLRDGGFQSGPFKYVFNLDKNGKPVLLERINGSDTVRFIPESEWTPTPADLTGFAGRWYSDEADANVSIVVENGQAFLTQRPNTRFTLRPIFKDHFVVERAGVIIWFTRDATGGTVKLHAGASRLRDMPFIRIQ